MPDILIIVFAGVFGLCFGSFANVIIYRLPKRLSIVKPPSACPDCGKRLRGLDLLPVLSWLFLRAKCRFCKKKISVRYPIVELLCGLLFAAMAWYTPTLSVLPLAVWAFVLLVISYIDADTQEIPDGLVITGAVAGIVFVAGASVFTDFFPGHPAAPVEPGDLPLWLNALLGAVAGAAPLLIIDRIVIWVLKKDGFGYGDVKLMAMVGLFLGWQLMLIAFFIAFMFGTVFIIYLAIRGKAKRGVYLAFGPFLCLGSVTAFFVGQPMLDWYVGLLA